MAQDIPPYFQERFLARFLLWEKKHWISSAAAFTLGLTLLIAYFQSGPKPITYAQAEEAFANWEASPEDEALYRDMRKALRSAPALEEKYAAPIAQRLIDGDMLQQAIPMAQNSLDLLREEAPFHASFGETSLLIEQRSFQEALEKAVSLKEKMFEDLTIEKLIESAPIAGGSVLYGQNLLRIAFLHKELGNKPGEKAAWDELENFFSQALSIRDLIEANFKEKGVDLSSYIHARRKHL